jgi:hypothetical protein
MAYQLIWIFADLASRSFSAATSSTRAATSTVIATIRAPGLVQEDGAIAIAQIPRVCFDLISADSWPLS